MSTFAWHGIELAYFDHPYNDTRLNERAVEIAVAQRWLDRVATGDGLEVGNVLGHYLPGPLRRVVDLFERDRGVDNIDVLDIDGTFDWIVAVSTIEHVGQDDGTQRLAAATHAVDHLRSLLRPGGQMLVTVPFGWNAALDGDIIGGALHAQRECTFTRHGGIDWTQAAQRVDWRPYGPRWASAVWVGEWWTA